jgi:hypothetical protein
LVLFFRKEQRKNLLFSGEEEAIPCPLENPAVWERFASGGQRLRLCTPLGPGAPDPDLLLGYSG